MRVFYRGGDYMQRRFCLASLWAGIFVAIIGGGHFIAWLAGVLAPLGFSTVTMKTNSALALLLAGCTLAVLSTRPQKPYWRWVAGVGAGVVLLIGLASLLQNVTGLDLGIDQLLASEPPGALGVSSPNRVAPPAAICFALTGTALLLLTPESGRRAKWGQVLALFVCVTSLLAVLGYMYRVTGPHMMHAMTSIAWPTAVALLALAFGILGVRPEQGLMALVTADNPGGVMLRRLLLPTAALMVVLGWLGLEGERHELYGTAFGAGLLVMAFTIVFSVLAYSTARTLSRASAAEEAAQHQLRQSKERLEQFIREAPVGLAMFDRNMRYLKVSNCFLRDVGLGDRNVIGQSHYQVFPNLPEHWKQAHQRGLNGEVVTGEEDWTAADGALHSIRWAIHPWGDSGVETGGILLFSEDITARKRVQDALRENEQRYRSFVEASAQVIWRTNPRGEVDQGIPSWNVFTGQNDAETAGFGWMAAIHPEDCPRVAEAWEQASNARARYQVEYRLKRRDGRWRHILARGVPVLNSDGQVREYICTCIDITERREAERAIQRQARLIDLSPAATLVRDPHGTISFWSDGAEKLYGWTREEALGEMTHELLSTVFPVPLQQILKELKQSGRWTGELLHRAKSGRSLMVESHWLGQFGPGGELIELMESDIDITERKRAERELLRLTDELEVRVQERTAELAEANKDLESFGYSVSHDLRAPLRHINSYIGLLQKSGGPGLDEKCSRYLRIVTEAAARMGNLMDDLLVLSRLSRANMEVQPVNLRQLVDESRQELAPAMAGRAIEWRIGPLPVVQGDPHLLRSAMVNLLGNAVKYTRHRNPAVIEVGSNHPDDEVIVHVRDNGAGFDMQFVDKLFGVFQRLHTANEFEGTGIGLASVRRVIQRHGGRTWAEGQPDRGATFYFSLPLSRVAENENAQAPPARQKQKV